MQKFFPESKYYLYKGKEYEAGKHKYFLCLSLMHLKYKLLLHFTMAVKEHHQNIYRHKEWIQMKLLLFLCVNVLELSQQK